MMNKTNRGFTLIELLVVVAIIGILSSVVLVSLNTARDRAKDSSIQAELAQMRSEAELLATDDGNYTNVCTAQTGDANPYKFYESALETFGGTGSEECNADSNGWAAWVPTVTDNTAVYCADASGFAGRLESADAPATGATSCN